MCAELQRNSKIEFLLVVCSQNRTPKSKACSIESSAQSKSKALLICSIESTAQSKIEIVVELLLNRKHWSWSSQNRKPIICFLLSDFKFTKRSIESTAHISFGFDYSLLRYLPLVIACEDFIQFILYIKIQ